VRVVRGAVFDVSVDLRKSSPNFGKWVGVELSEQNKRQLWVPTGFGHGFLVVSDAADFLYKTTEFWMGQHERSLRWNDSSLAVQWPLAGALPQLATKDATAPLLADAEVYA